MSHAQPLKLGLVCAEASGDLLAAHLFKTLRERWPGLQGFGVGGPHLQQQGFESWWPIERLSVRGYLEVLPRLPALLYMRSKLGQRLIQAAPDLFVGVDAPDFNFALQARLRQNQIRTLQFVSPSFWAWRPEKLQKLKAAADHVLCLFPFEPELLQEAGIAASYVGHPLAQEIPLQVDAMQARQELGLQENAVVIALLPGSRRAEIDHLAPRFFAAAAILAQEVPAARFVLPTLPWLHERVEDWARRSGAAELLGKRLHLVQNQSHAALAACDVTLIASGTASLEAALFKRPMVIAYAMPGFSYWLMRRRRQLPWVGLPNILCAPRRWLHRPPDVAAHAWADAADAPFVVPELIQHAATPQALADGVLDWLQNPDRMQRVQARFDSLHRQLRQDTAKLAAQAIERMLDA